MCKVCKMFYGNCDLFYGYYCRRLFVCVNIQKRCWKIQILCKYLDSLVGANRSSSSSSKRLLLWDILALGRLEGALALDFIPPVLLFGLIHWSCHSNIQERKCIILYVPWNVGMQQGNSTFCILVPHRRWRVSWSKPYWVAAWML